MGLKLPKFSNILDDIGGAATNVIHGIGNAAGAAVDAAIPGNQSSLHPSLAPHINPPNTPTGSLENPAQAGFGTGIGFLETQPGKAASHLIPSLIHPDVPIGATSIADPNQQPLQVGQAHPVQLQAPAPQKPNGQPLTATVVHTPTLQVGNQQIAQSPTAVSGVKAPVQPGNLGDAIGAAGASTISSALKGAASTVKGTSDLRFLTPNFIPGVSSTVDPLINRLSSNAASPLAALSKEYNQGAQNNDLYGTQAGQLGKTIGDVAGNTAIYAPQGVGVAEGAVNAVKALPTLAQHGASLLDTISSLNSNRTPLNEVGAIGRDVTPEGEQIANKVPSPAPGGITPPTGVEPNLGATGGVGQGTNSAGVSRAVDPTGKVPVGDQLESLLGQESSAQTQPNILNSIQNSSLENSSRNGLKSQESLVSGRDVTLPGELGDTPKIPDYQNSGSISLSGAGGKNMADISDSQAGHIARNADLAGKSEVANLATRHGILDNELQKAYKTPEEASALLDSIEHPEDLEKNVQAVAPERQQAFRNSVSGTHNLSDYVFNRHEDLGAPLEYRGNYLSHNVAAPDYVDEDFPSSTQQVSSPNYGKERQYADLRELNAAGHTLKYPDPRELFKDYTNRAASNLYRNGFLRSADEDAPGHIGVTRDAQPLDKTGARFTTGRTNGLQGNYFSPQLSKAIGKYVEPHDLGRGFHAIDKAVQTAKQTTLAFGGFHDLNLSYRNLAQEFGSALAGEPKRLLNVIIHPAKSDAAFWSKNAFQGLMKGYQDSGLLDRARDFKMTLGENLDVGKVPGQTENGVVRVVNGPSNLNEKLHAPLFGRKIPVLKMETLGAELKRAGIPLSGDLSPEQANEGRRIAQQIDNTYGGINSGFIAKTTLGKQLQRLVQLSPDFTGGNINSAATTFRAGAAGSLARRQNITNLASKLILGGAAAAAIGGPQYLGQQIKSDFNPKSSNFLNPGIPLPFKNSKGQRQVGHLPGDPLEEVAKIRDPVQFIKARGSSALSDAAQFVTGKNYYGEPLVNPNINPNPSTGQKLKAVAGSNLPIAINRTLSAKNGNTVPSAVLNTAGVSVSTDPTNPQYKATQEYFNLRDKTSSGLKPHDQDLFNSVMDSQYAPDGTTKVTLNNAQRQAQNLALAQNPRVQAAITQMYQNYAKQTGQKVDPLYTLPADKQAAYLRMEGSPYEGQDYTQLKTANNSWLPQFEQQRAAFYSSLPKSQNPTINTSVQFPNLGQNTQSLLTQYDNADTNTRSQLLQQHPEISDAFDQIAQYSNNVRSAEGYAQFKGYPEPNKQVQSELTAYDSLPTSSKSGYISSHPDVTSYLTQVSLYNLDKNAAQDQYKGATPNQQELKSAYGLGNYDITKNSDGTYSLSSGNTAGGSGGSYGGTGYTGGPGTTNLFTHSVKGAQIGIAGIRTAGSGLHFNTKSTVRVKSRGGAKVAKLGKPKTLNLKASKSLA